MHPMVTRVAAAQSAVDVFVGKAFVWGEADCARLAAFTLKALGHKPNIARFGFYKSPLSAAKALRKQGFADVGAWMDDLGLPRIAPAAALPGDILGFSHDDMPLRTGLAIALGNNRMLAFLADRVCHVCPMTYGAEGTEYTAWRADPACPS